jgi:hypothetical protein
MLRTLISHIIPLLGILLALAAPAVCAAASSAAPPVTAGGIKSTYLYNLSDFGGPKRISGPAMAFDPSQDEIYLLSGGTVSVYSNSGMEVHFFENSDESGTFYTMTVLPDGSLLMAIGTQKGTRLIKADFRGEPTGEFRLKGVPTSMTDFVPNWMLQQNGLLYLANTQSMQLVTTTLDGEITEVRDLAELAGIKDKDRDSNSIGTLAIAPDGTLVFSLPMTAKICRVSPDGKTVESFGKRGSTAGKFGVPSGVAIDKAGNIFVADKLRCMVLVFGPDLAFKNEFGDLGPNQGGLVVPSALVVDGSNRVYVSQLGNRGVSVFQLSGS